MHCFLRGLRALLASTSLSSFRRSLKQISQEVEAGMELSLAREMTTTVVS